MYQIAFIGDAQNPHFPKWLSALCEQDIRIDFISYEPPLMPIEGVTFHQIPLPFGNRKGWFNFHLAAASPFTKLLERLQPQLLMGSFGTNYGYLAMRTRFKPFLLQTWTRDLTIVPFEGLKRFFYRPVMDKVLQFADLVITDGAALADIGQTKFPLFADKIKPIRWGIRLSDFASSPEKRKLARQQWHIPEDAVVLTNGRGIYEWYNPEITLPALLKWVEHEPNGYAIILTNAHERTQNVQEMLILLSKHPQIRVIDERLPVSEVANIWAMTDGMISIPKFDGISEAILEAMYAGAIPIVNDIPSNRSFLQDQSNAFYTNTETADSFFASLVHFCKMPVPLRAVIIKRNQFFVEQEASVEASAKILATYIRELIRLAEKSD